MPLSRAAPGSRPGLDDQPSGQGVRLATRDGQIALAGSFAGRPLTASGRFQLVDSASVLQAAGTNRYTRRGAGPPVVLELEAEKVLVRR